MIKNLTDIYFYNPKSQSWQMRWVVSNTIVRKGIPHYLISSYGPPVHFRAVLTTDEYAKQIKAGVIKETEDVLKEVLA